MVLQENSGQTMAFKKNAIVQQLNVSPKHHHVVTEQATELFFKSNHLFRTYFYSGFVYEINLHHLFDGNYIHTVLSLFLGILPSRNVFSNK